MKNINICIISHSSGKYGAERSLLDLIDVLNDCGFNCFGIIPNNGPLKEDLSYRCKDIYKIYYTWWMSRNPSLLTSMLGTLWNIVAVLMICLKLKQWKCNVVITNTTVICVGAIASKLLKIPHIWYIREFGYEDHGLKFMFGESLSLWLIKKLSTIVICNSHAVSKKYSEYLQPSQLRVIYNPVMMDSIYCHNRLIDKSKGEIKCIIIGALYPGKRHEDAIKAIGVINDSGDTAKLVIMGTGDIKYRKFLNNLIIKNKLQDAVRFLGFVDNPLPFLGESDVLLNCSISEAFGRVTVEAMKLSKPVIGSRSGGTTELIKEGFNGLLYEPKNYVELAEKIKYFIDNPMELKRMGENGAKWAEKHINKENYKKEILAALSTIINQENR